MDGWALAGASLYDAAGALGVAFYLGSYFALQAGFVRGSSHLYAGLNIAASSLVLLSLARDFNLYSAVIQISWIAISVVGIARLIVLARRARFSPEEERMRRAVLGDMPRIAARRLLSAGAWTDARAGEELLREDRPARALIYLAEGRVLIRRGGREVACVEAPAFLGEMSVLSDLPASASAVTEGPARLWRAPADRLSRLASDPETRTQIEGALARDTRRKLISANARLAAPEAGAA